MKADLIITTYNRPEALAVVLTSVMNQKVLPYQVIIADDGSRCETKELIEEFQKKFPVTLIHSWHEDLGFRAAESRNRALSFVKSEYVIIVDGDLVLDENFVADHIFYSEKGCFLQGGRILMNEAKTKQILEQPNQKIKVGIFEPGLESRLEKRLTSFRSSLLASFFNKEMKNKNKVRSCNMSFYFNDIIAVNGFNNSFLGWGREDSEFVERLSNLGVKGKILKFVALGYHLYHLEESRCSLPLNDKILKCTVENNLIWCDDGMAKFRQLLQMEVNK